MPAPAPTRFPRPLPGTQPAYLHPPYASSVRRAPSRPLVLLPHTLTELTGPVFGHETVRPADADLTAQHAGEPLGERIVVTGRVLDEIGRPIRRHAGGGLAGQRRRPLPAPERRSPGPARSQLHGLWTGASPTTTAGTGS